MCAPPIGRNVYYSDRTEETYSHWIKRFVYFSGKRHPRELGAAEVTAFLSHLARDRDVAAATQNQALAALLFLYKEVLGQPLPWLDQIDRAKRPARLPTVLSVPEIQRLLGAMKGTKWLMASLLYGAGLRLRECLKLRVKDLDFDYRQILVRDAKGGKDRVTMLPASVIEPLREHLVRAKQLHERDLASDHGDVELPDALSRKYPKAPYEWGWKFVFPRTSSPQIRARAQSDAITSTRTISFAASRARWTGSSKREAAMRPVEQIASRILVIRERRVILDSDLAALYRVPVKRLNEQVRRNLPRFPSDFMFQLDKQELAILKPQIATSSWGGKRKPPLAFTEHGAIMAATVLNSPRAIEVSVHVVRAFVEMREALVAHKEIARRLEALERKLGTHDSTIRQILDAIRRLTQPPEPPKRKRIGFL